MDRLDRRILECLQRDAGTTNQALAERVGLSPSACLARVRRLRESGTIERTVALLDPAAAGPRVELVVEVFTERDDRALFERFERAAREAPEVRQCYRVTGDSDFVLIVSVPDMDAYDAFCDRVLYGDSNMAKFRTLVVRRRAKFDPFVPLGDGG